MLVKDADKWNTKTGNFEILKYKCCGMYFINFNYTISRRECSYCQNDAIWPLVAIQKNISVATKADEKSVRLMDKNCVTRTFCSQLASWDTRYQYETSELVVETLRINFNRWKKFENLHYTVLFRVMWWKINCVTPRSMEKRTRFCTSLYILGT